MGGVHYDPPGGAPLHRDAGDPERRHVREQCAGAEGVALHGDIVVQDGKFQWTESKTGSKGEFVLHEGDGKRVLIRTGQGSDSTGEYKPAK